MTECVIIVYCCFLLFYPRESPCLHKYEIILHDNLIAIEKFIIVLQAAVDTDYDDLYLYSRVNEHCIRQPAIHSSCSQSSLEFWELFVKC